jgi:ribosomal protein S18 acetylase RimI-like enzyme
MRFRKLTQTHASGFHSLLLVCVEDQPSSDIEPRCHGKNRTMEVNIQLADLALPEHQDAVVRLLDHYASQPMGNGQPLPEDVKFRLIDGLRAHPMTRIFLAFVDGSAVAIATCFVGFSTFKAKPLINIHDLAVHKEYQSQGIGTQLIEAVTDYAREMDCCAITLEVRRDNPARHLYLKKGFQVLDDPLPDHATLFGKLML